MNATAGPEPMTRVERLAPWAGGLFLALPVLVVRFPPMADLPLHEASVGLLRHWGDPTFAPHSVYFLNFGHANQLFSFLVYFVSLFVSVPWACKLVVAGSLLCLSLAAAHLADYLRAPRATALLVVPIGLGWLFFWGLIQNIVGLAVLLAALPTIDRFSATPTWRGAARVCALMVLFHFAHQAMQLVACMALVIFSVGFPAKPRATFLRSVPVAFCAALVYAASMYSWHFAGPRHQATLPFDWKPLSYKVASIPGVLFGGYTPYVRNLVMVLAVIPLALMVVDRVRHRDRRPRPFFERLHALRFELLAFGLFCIYLAAPFTIKSTTLVYHRFLPPAWAVLAIAAAATTSATARPLPRLLCAVLPLASVLIAWPTFVDADQIYSDLDALLPLVAKDSTFASLNFGPNAPDRLWSPMVAMGHVVAQKGGRSLFDYSQSPVSPVAQRPEKEWVEPISRMDKNCFALRPDWDFTRFRYLMAVTSNPSLAAGLTLAMRDDAVLIGHRGDLYLFESRLPLVPIDADDAPLPTPRPSSLTRRLDEVARELTAIDLGSSSPAEATP